MCKAVAIDAARHDATMDRAVRIRDSVVLGEACRGRREPDLLKFG
jgi:hypothetical protein